MGRPREKSVRGLMAANRIKPENVGNAVIAAAAVNGIPVPVFSVALNYYDGYRMARLPANLLQAQRDYFGAHTYKRVDKEGTFHSEWLDLRKQPTDK